MIKKLIFRVAFSKKTVLDFGRWFKTQTNVQRCTGLNQIYKRCKNYGQAKK